MTIFVDASALIAIIRNEPEANALEDRLDADPDRLTSGIAVWEAARAHGRNRDINGALSEVERYCAALRIAVVTITTSEATEACRVHARYGKGTGHPARLNLGDCFAYACAKTHGATLLYKGDDFTHTDLA